MKTRMTNRNRIREELISLGAYKDAVLGYLASVSFADAMLGRVLDTLEASAYKDNTVIVFWSDQGYHLGEKGQWGKHTLWQETTNVPLIFAGGGIPKGQEVNTTVSLIDLYPTFIDLCGLSQPHEMDGVSLMPVLRNPESAVDRNVMMPYIERGGFVVVNQNYRYIRYQDGSEELYDLENDPHEWTNLATDNSYREIMDEMANVAPSFFQEEATPRNTLKLVLNGENFYWEKKDKSEPAPLTQTSITFSDPRIEQGISLVESTDPADESYSLFTDVAGKGCRYVAADKYVSLVLNDSVFGQQDDHLMVDITYKGGTGNFELSYLATSGKYETITVTKENQSGWPVASLMIPDAAVAWNLPEETDLKIKGEVYIRSVIIQKHGPYEVSCTFSDPFVSHGMQFLFNTSDPSKETYTEAAAVIGTSCRYIPVTDKRKYGYFKVDDGRIMTEDNELTFEVTYYDDSAKLMLQYNSFNDNYEKVEITPSNTRKWVTKIIPVRDAALSNAQNNQSDFRIHGDVYVRRVALGKGINPFPAKKVDSIEVENLVYLSSQPDQANERVKISPGKNAVEILLPRDLAGADIFICNMLGVTVHHSTADRHRKSLNVSLKPGTYILSIQTKTKRISEKFTIA